MPDIGDDIFTELRALNHMACYMVYLHAVHHVTLYMQEQQSAKGADPQPEYYIDKIMHLTQVIGRVYPMYVHDDKLWELQ